MLILHVWFPSDGKGGGRDGEGEWGREGVLHLNDLQIIIKCICIFIFFGTPNTYLDFLIILNW